MSCKVFEALYCIPGTISSIVKSYFGKRKSQVTREFFAGMSAAISSSGRLCAQTLFVCVGRAKSNLTLGTF